MALTDPTDTLAYHQSRVVTSQRDMSSTPVQFVADKIKAYHGSTTDSHSTPEAQALWFYGMNHGMSLISARFAAQEPLPAWELAYVERYHREMGHRAVRAFYYLLLICTREARHNKSLGTCYPKMKELFGAPTANFFKLISGGESTIHQKLLTEPPLATIGEFCRCLQWQFYNSSWSPGYGGKAWGMIADCLTRFVTGEYSAEMMLDTIWTLSHNNGPIFNKGLYYKMYNGAMVLRILDVQRSGQIPEAVLYDHQIKAYAQAELISLMHTVNTHFPGEFGKYVDWYTVEALGSVGKYPNDKAAQVKAHGVSAKASEAEKKAAAAEAAKIAAQKKAAEEHAKNHFQVMPDLEVKIIHRLPQAA